MDVFLTVRRLKPGSFDDWRRAWQPEEIPAGFTRIYILRNRDDADEVIAFGLYEGDSDELRADPRRREDEARRAEAMAPYVEWTGADSVYEVVETINPPRHLSG